MPILRFNTASHIKAKGGAILETAQSNCQCPNQPKYTVSDHVDLKLQLVADAIMVVSFFRDSAPEDFASFDRSFLAMCVAGVKLRVWVRRVGFGWIR
jgi:hypothetical protein